MATISRGTKTEKFEFIGRYKAISSVTKLCKHLNVSRSGYYEWSHREKSNHALYDKKLMVSIRRIFNQSRETYGSPRVHHKLKLMGVSVGKKRVARLMRQAKLVAKISRTYPHKCKTRAMFQISENLRLKDKTTHSINTHWSSDITYLPFGKRWLYLAIVMDLHSRKVVGWSVGASKTTALVKRALKLAVKKRKPSPGLILHSDRGSEYGSIELKIYTDQNNIVRSMSRSYTSIDNAEVESFFQKFKGEFMIGKTFDSLKQLQRLIAQYVNGFYNSIRIHSSLNYLSPAQYEAIQG